MNAIPGNFLDERHAQAVRWAAAVIGREPLEFSIASADASFRRYFRARSGERSWIVMDAPPAQEDCRPFIEIAARLRDAGVPAPEVQAEDLDNGFLLLTDLGAATLLEIIDADNAERWFDEALDVLVRMQARVRSEGLPDYDRALLMRELALYPDWYLARHRGVELSADERRTWDAACERLVQSALAQPQVFVHRDFMPRNLMVAEGLAVIDFQDAVRGPVTYDLLSLFKDAFLSWPEERVDAWVEEYRRRAQAAGLVLPEDFRRAFDWMGLQRHLKVIGIFARLNYRDGKAKYLAETPRFFRYVYDVGAKYEEFAGLLELMRRYEGER
ncbi:MAG TPA: phosphotransferase [Gammaproteobacteria bacterium]|nr:phosphotransferase [Gammaproteobacteria bacterium]